MKLFEIRPAWRRMRQSAVFFGMFATGVRVGANLLLLPLLLNRLPSSDLAVWWVFLALGGFANLADFGFGPAIARVYSFLWAGAEDFDTEGLRAPPSSQEPNRGRIRQLTATVGYFYWRLSLAATAVLALVGTLVLIKPCTGVADPHLVWVAWAGYLLTIGYNLGTSRWLLACSGLGRVRELQAAYTWSGLAYVACAAALLLAGGGLLSLVVANALRGIVTRGVCAHAYFKAVPPVSPASTTPDREMLKRLWPNAYKFGLISLCVYFQNNSNVLISSNFLSHEITASFGLTAQIGTFLMTFAALWLVVKWPDLTMLRTQGREQEMSALFARRLTLTMGTFVFLAAMVVLTGNGLLAWKGTHTRLLATPALIFYFGYLTQQLFYVQFGSLAYTENFVPFFKVSLFTGLSIFLLSLALTRVFGFWGMLAAPLLAESVCSSWYTVRRGFRGQPLTPRQFLKAALSIPS